MSPPKITPFLWFNSDLNEAITFYTSIFKNASIKNIHRGPDGKVFSANFELEGQHFKALNGGPQFTFNEAISMFVTCADQEEVDYYWDHLLADGGKSMQCGWLKDRFGLVWQIIPEALGRYLTDEDAEKRNRTKEAMMQMVKISVEGLDKAYKG
ncbi:3-demethylubiquinone-9 3-methyltransferase [Trichophaea hybrida]|nr:3-demethylubiquinone-9 3-methyltransferase [Trichophaea hybrida]